MKPLWLAGLALCASAQTKPAISITDPPYLARSGSPTAPLCETNSRAIAAALAAASSLGTALVTIPPGVYPTRTVTPVSRDSHHSGLTLTGPGTLMSCAAEPLLKVVATHYGLRLENLNLDCNNTGTVGVYFGPATADNAVRGLQITGCTRNGMVLDGTQNSHFSDIAFYGDTLPLEIVNGAGELLFSRIEVQMAPASLNGIFIGNDAELPNFKQSPKSGANTISFEMVQIECNGYKSCTTPPGPIALNVGLGSSITMRDSIIDSGPIGGPALIHLNGGNNVFENNFYNTSEFDEKTFVNSTNFFIAADSPSIVRGGNIYFGGKCTQPFLTTSGLFIVDKLAYGLAAQPCMTFVDTSGKGLAETVNFIPRSHSGGAFANVPPPVGTAGSFFFHPVNGPEWWSNNRYVDAAGNAPGQCRVSNGSGSPNGVVAGSPCDQYRNTAADGKVPAVWSKESGANTKTGWRGEANGYTVSCSDSASHNFTPEWQTAAGCALDVNGVWEITATVVGVNCGAPDVCSAALSVPGAAANEIDSAARGVSYLMLDPLTTKVTGAPVRALVQMRKGATAGSSVAGQVRIHAKLLYAE